MSQTNGSKKNQKNQDLDLNNIGKKFTELVSIAGQELKKTTAIGKKMISASRSNSSLHDCYEQLGILVMKEVNSGQLKWENKKAHELIKEIEGLKNELEQFEEDVQKIKSQK